ncbi:DUF4253 domain-containing protein [Micromonospora sp. NBC_01740]|uniref:DUF4253 domain-containing protein n=1 Tax=Micromonospora sp. NBC_01740 TaxID=2975986 RepID=UPI002E1016FD|nr:DUF4253 domain-containing protein [Micromonospora sp. NBC_01740]
MISDLSRLLSSLPPATLPPGRTVEPEDGGPPPYWLSDAPVDPGLWARMRSRHPESGLWPLLLSGLSSDESRPWADGEVSPADMSSPEQHDVAKVLARWWADCATTGEDGTSDVTAPFGQDWPGLAPPGDLAEAPDVLADECAEFLVDGRTRLGLVPAARSADTLAVVGWYGPANHTGDAGEISAVLRSWEDRFGVRVVGVGFATLNLSVAAPPTSTGHALAVAAEHFAFCPDNVWQGAGSLTAYAEQLLGLHSWSFWWD